MNPKKAQGLPVNVIIIAIIVLIVLVVLVAIFTGKMGEWIGGIKSCTNIGGNCRTSCFTTEKEVINTDCSKTDQKCCIPIPT